MFVVASFSVTGVQHVQFCLNHFSSSVYVGTPTGNDWCETQTNGSLNIVCPSWTDWFHGGLQFQIEHHLFPRLPRRNLRKIAPLSRHSARSTTCLTQVCHSTRPMNSPSGHCARQRCRLAI
ncbi:hypothetical protein ACFX2I_016496 [Malus domestica]